MSEEMANGKSPVAEIKEDGPQQESEKPVEDGANVGTEGDGSGTESQPTAAEGEGGEGGGEGEGEGEGGGGEEGDAGETVGSEVAIAEQETEGDGGEGGGEGEGEGEGGEGEEGRNTKEPEGELGNTEIAVKFQKEEEDASKAEQHRAEDAAEDKLHEGAHEDYMTAVTAATEMTEYTIPASETTNELEDRPVGVPSDSALGPSPSSSMQPGLTVDGVQVLDDIREEEEEEEENEEVRQELIAKILQAAAERDRMQELSSQIQSEIAVYLAQKKEEEKADPGRTVIDHEKKYYQCMASLEHLHEEIKQVKQKTERETEDLIALKNKKLEEVEQAKMEFVKYRREKVLNVVDQRTGRKLTVKELERYQALEDKKEKDIVQIRLECIKLQNKIAKVEASIKQKEQLVGGLHLIDFEQLKINNVDLNEKIEERNDDILKLKKKVTSTVEVLTHVKEKLQFLQTENAEKKEALRDIEAVVAKKRDHLTRIKRTRDSLRADNMKLRQKGGLVGHTSLLRDFEERMDQSKAMYERLEFLQKRQAELTVMCDGLKKKIEQAKYVSTSHV